MNLSILDGWWVEGYRGENSWAIGPDTPDPEQQDYEDAAARYSLLEEQVVPTLFDKDPDGVRRKWIAIMKASIQSCVLPFSAHRMVRDYAEKMYLPLAGARKGEPKSNSLLERVAFQRSGVRSGAFGRDLAPEKRATFTD